jgi:diadenosine tetraphosphate (Ap4A) HIT family hydrolase
MVVAKRHVQNVSDLPEEEWAHFGRAQRRAEQALLDETGTERAILLKLGIQTPHLHIHIYPLSAALDRAAVMNVIDARVSEPRDADFASRVRARLTQSLR